MPHMHFGGGANGGYMGGSQLSFGGNSFSAMIASGYQQPGAVPDDEFTMGMNSVP